MDSASIMTTYALNVSCRCAANIMSSVGELHKTHRYAPIILGATSLKVCKFNVSDEILLDTSQPGDIAKLPQALCRIFKRQPFVLLLQGKIQLESTITLMPFDMVNHKHRYSPIHTFRKLRNMARSTAQTGSKACQVASVSAQHKNRLRLSRTTESESCSKTRLLYVELGLEWHAASIPSTHRSRGRAVVCLEMDTWRSLDLLKVYSEYKYILRLIKTLAAHQDSPSHVAPDRRWREVVGPICPVLVGVIQPNL